MKILEFYTRVMNIIKIIIPLENYENHEILRIPNENLENHENLIIQREN